MVREIQQQFPRAGYRQILAILKTQGVFVREHELRLTIQRVDPLGACLPEMVCYSREAKLQCQRPVSIMAYGWKP